MCGYTILIIGLNKLKMGTDKTKLQKQFELQTPTIMGNSISGKEYLQTYCAWLEFQVEKLSNKPEVINIGTNTGTIQM
jgi:hypothetical protein